MNKIKISLILALTIASLSTIVEAASPLQELFFAVKIGDTETVRSILLQKKINLNSTDQKGLTPLMYAGSSGDIAKLIVSADPITVQARTAAGDTVIIAMIKNFKENRDFFYTMNPTYKPTVAENIPGDIYTYKVMDVIDYLLKQGDQINARNKAGETALDWAVKLNNPELVRSLLTEGATFNEALIKKAPATLRSILLEFSFEMI